MTVNTPEYLDATTGWTVSDERPSGGRSTLHFPKEERAMNSQ